MTAELSENWLTSEPRKFSLLIIVHIETQKLKVLGANQKNDKVRGASVEKWSQPSKKRNRKATVGHLDSSACFRHPQPDQPRFRGYAWVVRGSAEGRHDLVRTRKAIKP